MVRATVCGCHCVIRPHGAVYVVALQVALPVCVIADVATLEQTLPSASSRSSASCCSTQASGIRWPCSEKSSPSSRSVATNSLAKHTSHASLPRWYECVVSTFVVQRKHPGQPVPLKRRRQLIESAGPKSLTDRVINLFSCLKGFKAQSDGAVSSGKRSVLPVSELIMQRKYGIKFEVTEQDRVDRALAHEPIYNTGKVVVAPRVPEMKYQRKPSRHRGRDTGRGVSSRNRGSTVLSMYSDSKDSGGHSSTGFTPKPMDEKYFLAEEPDLTPEALLEQQSQAAHSDDARSVVSGTTASSAQRGADVQDTLSVVGGPAAAKAPQGESDTDTDSDSSDGVGPMRRTWVRAELARTRETQAADGEARRAISGTGAGNTPRNHNVAPNLDDMRRLEIATRTAAMVAATATQLEHEEAMRAERRRAREERRKRRRERRELQARQQQHGGVPERRLSLSSHGSLASGLSGDSGSSFTNSMDPYSTGGARFAGAGVDPALDGMLGQLKPTASFRKREGKQRFRSDEKDAYMPYVVCIDESCVCVCVCVCVSCGPRVAHPRVVRPTGTSPIEAARSPAVGGRTKRGCGHAPQHTGLIPLAALLVWKRPASRCHPPSPSSTTRLLLHAQMGARFRRSGSGHAVGLRFGGPAKEGRWDRRGSAQRCSTKLHPGRCGDGGFLACRSSALLVEQWALEGASYVARSRQHSFRL